MQSEPSSGIKLTAYSCICWLFHRIYYDARNHKHEVPLCITCKIEANESQVAVPITEAVKPLPHKIYKLQICSPGGNEI